MRAFGPEMGSRCRAKALPFPFTRKGEPLQRKINSQINSRERGPDVREQVKEGEKKRKKKKDYKEQHERLFNGTTASDARISKKV